MSRDNEAAAYLEAVKAREEREVRDRFAMAALTGLIANSEASTTGMEPTISYLESRRDGSWLAQISYLIADAMMEARK